MLLTDEEQKMLEGEYGRGTAMAMQIQVGIAKCFDAPRMVPVRKVHVSLSAQEADLWFTSRLLAAGAACRVAPTVNPGYSVCAFASVLTPAAKEHMRRVDEVYSRLGARMTYCCTPYLYQNRPEKDEVCAFSETSATVFVNSVLGARTNRESAASAMCAAITGCVPEYGMLLETNRFGTVAVEVRAAMKTAEDYTLLGMLGKKIGQGNPVFLGLPASIPVEDLIALGASLNVSGNYDIYAVPGATPGIRDAVDAFGGKEPVRSVTITQADIDALKEQERPPAGRKISCCVLGCPHYTLAQTEKVDALLTRPAAVPIYILTAEEVVAEAVRTGLLTRLAQRGARLIPHTCVDEADCWHFLSGTLGVTDSAKAAYYMTSAGVTLAVQDVEICVEWAMEGKVC